MMSLGLRARLLGGISALALTAVAPLAAQAQSVTQLEVGTPTTGQALEGAYGVGDVNAIASQVNDGAVLSSRVATEGSSSVTTTVLTTTGGAAPITNASVSVADPITQPGTGGNVSLTLGLGAVDGSTAQVLSNAVNSLTAGNQASRELNLDLVSGTLPTALLGLSQSNSGVTGTAQIGAPAGTLTPGAAEYTGTGGFAAFDQATLGTTFLALAGATSTTQTNGTITQTVETTGGPSGTTIGILATSATGSTLTVGDNAVQAQVLFNSATQSATGAAQSLAAGGVAASAEILANAPPTATPFSVTVVSPVSVGTVQNNAGVNVASTAATPTSSVYNTSIGIALDGVSGGTAQVSTNAVSAALGLNTATTTIGLDGDASASFSNGVAATTVQTNTVTGVLGALVTGTDIGIQVGTPAPAVYTGSALVFSNAVDSLATGNVAGTTIGNTLATALDGNFARTAPNVVVSATGASVGGDMISTTYQTNTATNLLAQTDATQVAIAGSVVGLAALEANTVNATARLNDATSRITGLRGDGMTSASLISQTNIGGAAQSSVSGTEVIAAGIGTDSGTTVSIMANQVGASSTFNRAAQTATVATSEATVGGTPPAPSYASVEVTSAPQVSVGAQVSLTSVQANVNLGPIAGVNSTLPITLQPAALTTGTEIGASLFPGAGPVASMTATVAGNAVTAGVMGNQASNVLTFGGAALNDVAGASVFAGQTNANPGNMAAVVSDTRVGLEVTGGFLGTASVDQNRVASSSVGNSSVNQIGNTLATALQGSVAVAPTQTVRLNGGGTVFSAIGDYVVGNLQSNLGTAVAATTQGTEVGVALGGTGPNLSAGTVASASANQVLATATLNETQNTLRLVGGDSLVGSLANYQGNDVGTGTPVVESSATARVENTLIGVELGTATAMGTATGSTLLLGGNTVRAAASGNVATNTVSNGGLSTGSVVGQASSTIEAPTAPTTAVVGDYVIANRQQNVGTSAAAPFAVSATVLNADLSIRGGLSGSVAQMGGNTVLASATGNMATNRLGMTGTLSASLAEMSLQENRNATVTASVQGARMTVASAPTTGTSTALLSGNVVGAQASGNMLTSIVGR